MDSTVRDVSNIPVHSNDSDNNVTEFDNWEFLKREYNVKPLSFHGYMLTGVYLLVVGILATTGNLIVIRIFYKQKKLLKNPQNLLILNLSLSDLGISLFGYPLTTSSCFAQRYLYGEIGCVIQGLTTFTFALSSMNTLVCLSMYRYINMCWPHYKYRLNISFTRMVIAGSWVYTLFWTLPPLFGWNRYVLEPFGTSCSNDWTLRTPSGLSYNCCLIIFCFIINVGIMTFCYQRLVSTSRRLMRKIRMTQSKAMSIEDAVETKAFASEDKLVWMSLSMVVSFAVVWSPYAFLSLAYMFNPELPPWVATLPTMFCKSSCVINPVIYCLFNHDFRKYVFGIFSRGRKVQAQVPAKVKARVVVDRTRDGIYLGDTQVEVRHENRILF